MAVTSYLGLPEWFPGLAVESAASTAGPAVGIEAVGVMANEFGSAAEIHLVCAYSGQALCLIDVDYAGEKPHLTIPFDKRDFLRLWGEDEDMQRQLADGAGGGREGLSRCTLWMENSRVVLKDDDGKGGCWQSRQRNGSVILRGPDEVAPHLRRAIEEGTV